jgi:hypothetical protein
MNAIQQACELIAGAADVLAANKVYSCIDTEGGLHLSMHEADAGNAEAVCRKFSLLWQRARGEREDTYRCVEFPVTLCVNKRKTVAQTVPEELVFSEQ